MLPFITFSLTPKDAARRILLFNVENNGFVNDSFTIKPNEHVCLGYLTGARLFDYKNVIVPAKQIIVRTFEKYQSTGLERIMGSIRKSQEELNKKLDNIDNEIQQLSTNLNKKLDRILNISTKQQSDSKRIEN